MTSTHFFVFKEQDVSSSKSSVLRKKWSANCVSENENFAGKCFFSYDKYSVFFLFPICLPIYLFTPTETRRFAVCTVLIWKTEFWALGVTRRKVNTSNWLHTPYRQTWETGTRKCKPTSLLRTIFHLGWAIMWCNMFY